MVFGTGGIYAEVLNDFAFRLAPLDDDEAREMINKTKVGQILKGVRGEKPAKSEGARLPRSYRFPVWPKRIL